MTTRRALPAPPLDLRFTQLALAGALAASLAGCSGSDDSGGDTTAPPTGPGAFFLDTVSNGFGLQLPHSILEPDPAGGMQSRFLRTVEDIAAYVDQTTRIQPPASFPPQAVLPTGAAGNHYFLAQFSDAVDAPIAFFGACNGFDCEFLEVTSIDPATQAEVVLPVRFFIGGQSVSDSNLVPWVSYDASSGDLVGLIPEADGFPGLGTSQFPGAASMVAESSIVAVMDADDNLSTLEAFPAGVTLRLRIPNYLQSVDRVELEQAGVATTTVGADQIAPEVLGGPTAPQTRPFNGAMGVDPATSVDVLFTESIQPPTLGSLIDPFGGALQLTQGPSNLLSAYNYTVQPRTAYDLTRFSLVPDRTFNGVRADGMQPNSALADVRVTGDGEFEDLAATSGPQGTAGNQSSLPFAAQFRVGIAPGRANTPVVPEALYVARSGDVPGLSVIDLNGFGQSTGSPIQTGTVPQKGETRFPYNPNVSLQPAIRPLLVPGVSTIDGGSAGIFTLTLDTNLESLLASAPVLADTSDMQLGAALDTVLRNAPPPFGCQIGGGNVCALDGLKALFPGSPFGAIDPGFPNLISAAPHPNPPRLTFPARCVLPNIEVDEPTSIDPQGAVNLLTIGDPFGDPGAGIPPSGLLNGPMFGPLPFGGPSFGQVSTQNCSNYFVRQHIGQFLYVADRVRGEIVCLNSNRTTVLERIPVADPTSMAISPNVNLLAVSGTLMNVVTIIDINPASATFHTILAQVPVGDAPSGIAFDPLNEDIIVCNEGAGTLSIIDPTTMSVRKTVPSRVDQPFELAVTPRMEGFAFERGVYFAYVLGRDGQVAVFESGPDGPAGFGFDTTIGVLPFTFQAPKAIVLDPVNLDASVYIAYEGPIDPVTGTAGALGDGAISRVRIESALFGPIPIGGGAPGFRNMDYSIPVTLAESAGQLSGVPSDVAFDEISNMGHLPAPTSAFTSGFPAAVNGKALIRRVNASQVVVTSRPVVLLASMPAEGLVDVVRIGLTTPALLDVCANDPGVQSIEVPNVVSLTGYFSQ